MSDALDFREAERRIVASERFQTLGQTARAWMAHAALDGHERARAIVWYLAAQDLLGPQVERGEISPKRLAEHLGVSRWTEWRWRQLAAEGGLVRAWELPVDRGRGYGRGAVRVLQLAFIRTKAVVKTALEERDQRRKKRGKSCREGRTRPGPPVGQRAPRAARERIAEAIDRSLGEAARSGWVEPGPLVSCEAPQRETAGPRPDGRAPPGS